jgi:biotin transport system permease protein
VPPPSLLPVHRPGSSWLHRCPGGAKLGVLVVLAAVVGLRTGPALPLVLLAAVLLAAVTAQLGAAVLVGALRTTAVLVVFAATWAGVSRGAGAAVEVGTDVCAAVLAGAAVTATTSTEELLDLVLAAARPLRHLGLPPERLAVAVALTLRSVPVLVALALESRDAARARGLERSVRAATVPLVLRTVEHAHAVADALAARGLGEEAPRRGGAPG